MTPTDGDERERLASHATLVRLANSCERAASRDAGSAPHAGDLNRDDFREIADLLRKFAQMIA